MAEIPSNPFENNTSVWRYEPPILPIWDVLSNSTLAGANLAQSIANNVLNSSEGFGLKFSKPGYSVGLSWDRAAYHAGPVYLLDEEFSTHLGYHIGKGFVQESELETAVMKVNFDDERSYLRSFKILSASETISIYDGMMHAEKPSLDLASVKLADQVSYCQGNNRVTVEPHVTFHIPMPLVSARKFPISGGIDFKHSEYSQQCVLEKQDFIRHHGKFWGNIEADIPHDFKGTASWDGTKHAVMHTVQNSVAANVPLDQISPLTASALKAFTPYSYKDLTQPIFPHEAKTATYPGSNHTQADTHESVLPIWDMNSKNPASPMGSGYPNASLDTNISKSGLSAGLGLHNGDTNYHLGLSKFGMPDSFTVGKEFSLYKQDHVHLGDVGYHLTLNKDSINLGAEEGLVNVSIHDNHSFIQSVGLVAGSQELVIKPGEFEASFKLPSLASATLGDTVYFCVGKELVISQPHVTVAFPEIIDGFGTRESMHYSPRCALEEQNYIKSYGKFWGPLRADIPHDGRTTASLSGTVQGVEHLFSSQKLVQQPLSAEVKPLSTPQPVNLAPENLKIGTHMPAQHNVLLDPKLPVTPASLKAPIIDPSMKTSSNAQMLNILKSGDPGALHAMACVRAEANFEEIKVVYQKLGEVAGVLSSPEVGMLASVMGRDGQKLMEGVHWLNNSLTAVKLAQNLYSAYEKADGLLTMSSAAKNIIETLAGVSDISQVSSAAVQTASGAIEVGAQAKTAFSVLQSELGMSSLTAAVVLLVVEEVLPKVIHNEQAEMVLNNVIMFLTMNPSTFMVAVAFEIIVTVFGAQLSDWYESIFHHHRHKIEKEIKHAVHEVQDASNALKSHNYAKAEAEAKDVLAKAHSQGWYNNDKAQGCIDEAYQILIQVDLHRKQYAEALNLAKELVRHHCTPGNEMVLASVYDAMGHLAQAISVYQQVINSSSSTREERLLATAHIANDYFREGQYNKAISYSKNVINYLKTHNYDVLMNKDSRAAVMMAYDTEISSYLREGNYKAAEACAQERVDSLTGQMHVTNFFGAGFFFAPSPEFMQDVCASYNSLINADLSGHDTAKARADIAQARKTIDQMQKELANPHGPWILRALMAQRNAQEATELHAENNDLNMLEARSYLCDKNYGEAIKWAEKVLNDHSSGWQNTDVGQQSLVGACEVEVQAYLGEKDYAAAEKAVQQYENAVRGRENWLSAHRNDKNVNYDQEIAQAHAAMAEGALFSIQIDLGKGDYTAAMAKAEALLAQAESKPDWMNTDQGTNIACQACQSLFSGAMGAKDYAKAHTAAAKLREEIKNRDAWLSQHANDANVDLQKEHAQDDALLLQSYEDDASAYLAQGKYADAIASAEKVLAEAAAHPDSLTTDNGTNVVCQACQTVFNGAMGEKDYARAHQAAAQLRDKLKQRDAWLSKHAKDPDVEHGKESAQDGALWLQSYEDDASAYMAEGKYDQAIAAAQKVLSEAKARPNSLSTDSGRHVEISALQLLAGAYIAMGDFAHAEATINQMEQAVSAYEAWFAKHKNDKDIDAKADAQYIQVEKAATVLLTAQIDVAQGNNALAIKETQKVLANKALQDSDAGLSQRTQAFQMQASIYLSEKNIAAAEEAVKNYLNSVNKHSNWLAKHKNDKDVNYPKESHDLAIAKAEGELLQTSVLMAKGDYLQALAEADSILKNHSLGEDSKAWGVYAQAHQTKAQCDMAMHSYALAHAEVAKAYQAIEQAEAKYKSEHPHDNLKDDPKWAGYKTQLIGCDLLDMQIDIQEKNYGSALNIAKHVLAEVEDKQGHRSAWANTVAGHEKIMQAYAQTVTVYCLEKNYKAARNEIKKMRDEAKAEAEYAKNLQDGDKRKALEQDAKFELDKCAACEVEISLAEKNYHEAVREADALIAKLKHDGADSTAKGQSQLEQAYRLKAQGLMGEKNYGHALAVIKHLIAEEKAKGKDDIQDKLLYAQYATQAHDYKHASEYFNKVITDPNSSISDVWNAHMGFAQMYIQEATNTTGFMAKDDCFRHAFEQFSKALTELDEKDLSGHSTGKQMADYWHSRQQTLKTMEKYGEQLVHSEAVQAHRLLEVMEKQAPHARETYLLRQEEIREDHISLAQFATYGVYSIFRLRFIKHRVDQAIDTLPSAVRASLHAMFDMGPALYGTLGPLVFNSIRYHGLGKNLKHMSTTSDVMLVVQVILVLLRAAGHYKKISGDPIPPEMLQPITEALSTCSSTTSLATSSSVTHKTLMTDISIFSASLVLFDLLVKIGPYKHIAVEKPYLYTVGITSSSLRWFFSAHFLSSLAKSSISLDKSYFALRMKIASGLRAGLAKSAVAKAAVTKTCTTLGISGVSLALGGTTLAVIVPLECAQMYRRRHSLAFQRLANKASRWAGFSGVSDTDVENFLISLTARIRFLKGDEYIRANTLRQKILENYVLYLATQGKKSASQLNKIVQDAENGFSEALKLSKAKVLEKIEVLKLIAAQQYYAALHEIFMNIKFPPSISGKRQPGKHGKLPWDAKLLALNPKLLSTIVGDFCENLTKAASLHYANFILKCLIGLKKPNYKLALDLLVAIHDNYGSNIWAYADSLRMVGQTAWRSYCAGDKRGLSLIKDEMKLLTVKAQGKGLDKTGWLYNKPTNKVSSFFWHCKQALTWNAGEEENWSLAEFFESRQKQVSSDLEFTFMDLELAETIKSSMPAGRVQVMEDMLFHLSLMEFCEFCQTERNEKAATDALAAMVNSLHVYMKKQATIWNYFTPGKYMVPDVIGNQLFSQQFLQWLMAVVSGVERLYASQQFESAAAVMQGLTTLFENDPIIKSLVSFDEKANQYFAHENFKFSDNLNQQLAQLSAIQQPLSLAVPIMQCDEAKSIQAAIACENAVTIISALKTTFVRGMQIRSDELHKDQVVFCERLLAMLEARQANINKVKSLADQHKAQHTKVKPKTKSVEPTQAFGKKSGRFFPEASKTRSAVKKQKDIFADEDLFNSSESNPLFAEENLFDDQALATGSLIGGGI